MTRIVGGSLGRPAAGTPPAGRPGPTSEKVRAALANSLMAAGGLDGARVLDLYAGSGALGLELVSRGAHRRCSVEQRPARADRAAGERGRRCRPSARRSDGGCAGDVAAFAASHRGAGPFDIVVADPPYDLPTDGRWPRCSRPAVAAGLLAPGRRPGRSSAAAGPASRSWPAPLDGRPRPEYGDTLLCYGRAP